MFDFLFEGSLTVLLLLGVAAALLLALWYRDRRAGWLWGVLVVSVLILLYLGLDRLVETRDEQIRRKLGEMTSAVQKRTIPQASRHLSDQFTYERFKKKEFVDYWDNVAQRGIVTDIVIWNLRPGDRPGQFSFQAKPKGPNIPDGLYADVQAEFAREADGEWRLRTFKEIRVPLLGPGPFQLPGHFP